MSIDRVASSLKRHEAKCCVVDQQITHKKFRACIPTFECFLLNLFVYFVYIEWYTFKLRQSDLNIHRQEMFLEMCMRVLEWCNREWYKTKCEENYEKCICKSPRNKGLLWLQVFKSTDNQYLAISFIKFEIETDCDETLAS